MRKKTMDIRNTFSVALEIAKLAGEYEDLALETENQELKKVYTDFVAKLDEHHSKLLQLSMYSTDKFKAAKAVNTIEIDDLPKYCQLDVYYDYPSENLALVETTGGSMHLIPLDCLRYE